MKTGNMKTKVKHIKLNLNSLCYVPLTFQISRSWQKGQASHTFIKHELRIISRSFNTYTWWKWTLRQLTCLGLQDNLTMRRQWGILKSLVSLVRESESVCVADNIKSLPQHRCQVAVAVLWLVQGQGQEGGRVALLPSWGVVRSPPGLVASPIVAFKIPASIDTPMASTLILANYYSLHTQSVSTYQRAGWSYSSSNQKFQCCFLHPINTKLKSSPKYPVFPSQQRKCCVCDLRSWAEGHCDFSCWRLAHNVHLWIH